MKTLIAATLLVTVAAPAVAETVYDTRAMNPKLDGFTPGVRPAGAAQANTGQQPTCRQVTADFRYPDGSVRRESKTKCD